MMKTYGSISHSHLTHNNTVPCCWTQGALAAALEALRAQLGPQETEVVVVTGVGGTDDKTNTHKHASHTKGGTVDSAALEALTSGASSKLLATRYELTAQSVFLSAFNNGTSKKSTVLIRS